MKKAKIMLAAVAVLAVVGGSLAFKAKTFNEARIYYSSNGSCEDFTSLKYTTVQADGLIPTTFSFTTYSFESTPGGCAGVTVYSQL